jgi:hypothetical protein
MSHKIYSKPSLDAESFQRLLAAAFILQSRAEWIARKPVRTVDAKRFAARAIAQTAIAQTPSRRVRPSLARPGAWSEATDVSSLSGPMLWKAVEALTIAFVICLMMGLSIHHLLADPRGSSASGMLQTRDADRLTGSTPQALLSSVMASSQQPDATQKSRNSQDDGEGEVNAYDEDLVIHYRPRTANFPEAIGKGMTGGAALAQRSPRQHMQEAALFTEKVVQYGDDVTMWSSLKRPSLVQSDKAAPNVEKR